MFRAAGSDTQQLRRVASRAPPESRGAGDVSFVAPYTTGMDGLGVSGRGAHSPDESVNLNSLTMAAERAAVFIRRLITGARQPAPLP